MSSRARVPTKALVGTMTCAALAVIAGCGGSAHGGLPIAVPGSSVNSSVVGAGSLSAATLTVASGTTDLSITVANLHGRLVTASTAVDSQQLPRLTLTGDVATLHLNSASGSSPADVNVTLASSVAWTINLDGGATDETVNMTGGKLITLALDAGATDIAVTVSALAGTQTIDETGGASQLTVSAPRSVATNVHVTGGATSVVIGSVSHGGVGGEQTFASPGYTTAAQRLDVELHGGVSSARIT